MALSPLLEVRNHSVSYCSANARTRVLRELSLQIFENETLALIGESGSGKSTLARALLGLSGGDAVSGEILFQGTPLHLLDNKSWRTIRGGQIGMVFQDSRSALNPVLTVEQHLVETLRSHQKLSKKQARLKAAALLAEVGVSQDQAKHFSFELSGGTCQRIGIILGICNQPLLLIADEPTSSLDSANEARILELLGALNEYGMALLFISHDLQLVSRTADRIAVMYHGRIVESGLMEEVLSAPLHPYTRALIESRIEMHHHHERLRLPVVPGTMPRAEEEFPGCAFFARCSMALPECNRATPRPYIVSDTHEVACFACAGEEIQKAEQEIS